MDAGTGVRSDQVVWFRRRQSIERYPDRLRRISYRDPESGKSLVFLTNNFDLPALTITRLYKCRWGVELFFKWVKPEFADQALFRHERQCGEDAVWIAICVYVLVAIARKDKAGLEFVPNLADFERERI